MLTANYLGNASIAILATEPEPPAPGQVQIEVAYTGICGTDLHVLHGEMDGAGEAAGHPRARDERRDRGPRGWR